MGINIYVTYPNPKEAKKIRSADHNGQPSTVNNPKQTLALKKVPARKKAKRHCLGQTICSCWRISKKARTITSQINTGTTYFSAAKSSQKSHQKTLTAKVVKAKRSGRELNQETGRGLRKKIKTRLDKIARLKEYQNQPGRHKAHSQPARMPKRGSQKVKNPRISSKEKKRQQGHSGPESQKQD